MSVANFAISALVGSSHATTMPWPMKIFGSQVCTHRVLNRANGTILILSKNGNVFPQKWHYFAIKIIPLANFKNKCYLTSPAV